MLKTTETLLAGLAANNQSRWARFYRDYAPWIENVLRAKGINPHDAEDIIHETLVELVRIMPTYKYDPERKGSFHSLIFKIAQNKAIDLRRRNSREQDHLEKFASDPTRTGDYNARTTPSFEVSEEEWLHAQNRRHPVFVQGHGTLKAPDLACCEIHLAPGVTFITTGRFKPDGFLIKTPVPPPDAHWDSPIGYPAFVIEKGAKLIFTENATYPLTLIRTN